MSIVSLSFSQNFPSPLISIIFSGELLENLNISSFQKFFQLFALYIPRMIPPKRVRNRVFVIISLRDILYKESDENNQLLTKIM
jgi:hypothetical protein